MIFCKLEGDPEIPDLDGGPNGGNGLCDIDAAVGLVIADELQLLPWVELRPELTEERLDCVEDKTGTVEGNLGALEILLGAPLEPGREV